MQTSIKIDRSKLSERWLGDFKAKHLFALTLEVGSSDLKRTAGLSQDGEPTWLYQSAPQAHREFKYYVPGEWYNYGLGEKVLSVTLVREDGKIWHKEVTR
jgi:hypothetical protein